MCAISAKYSNDFSNFAEKCAMANNNIKYQFALDEDGNLISINDITQENRKQHTYKCIACGNELLPRAIGSKARRPHFYHKELVTCSGETYLHKLTKLSIMEKFFFSDKFEIAYPIETSCNNSNCQLRNRHCKEYNNSYTIDLKKYYDTCQEEVAIKGFVADLLLTSSQHPELEPILIEVCVSHSCEPEKRDSGLKIIEMKIKNEEDIRKLYLANCIQEYPSYSMDKAMDVEFIGFKRSFQKPMTTGISRYVFDPQIHVNGYLCPINCSQANIKINSHSLIELNMVSPYQWLRIDIPLKWLAIYNNVRRCDLCKFYYKTDYEFSPICRLSKKYGKPAHPEKNEAERCHSYFANINFFKEELQEYKIEVVKGEVYQSDKEEYKVIIAGSNTFQNYDLLKEKCSSYLSNKLQSHKVIILSGTSYFTKQMINTLAAELNIVVEMNLADWDRYGEAAPDMSNKSMVERADALIAFWDGKSYKTKLLIEIARAKGIPVKVVKF